MGRPPAVDGAAAVPPGLPRSPAVPPRTDVSVERVIAEPGEFWSEIRKFFTMPSAARSGGLGLRKDSRHDFTVIRVS